MVSWSHTKYQSCGGVLNLLQLQDDTLRQAGENAVTVVQSTDDECVDKLLQHLLVDVFTCFSETP